MAITISGNAHSGSVIEDTVFNFATEKQDLRITNNGAVLLEVIINGDITEIPSGKFYSHDGYLSTFRLRPKGGTGYYYLSANDSLKAANANLEFSKKNYINVIEKYGIDNTGTNFVSQAINMIIASLNNGDVLYFPSGIYLCNSKIVISKNIAIIGDYVPPDFSGNEASKNMGTIFKNTIANTTVIESNDLVRCYVKCITIDGNSCDFVDNIWTALHGTELMEVNTYTETLTNVNGIHVKRYYSVIEDVLVRNCSGLAFNLGSFNFSSRCMAMQCNKAIDLQFDNSVHQFRAQWVNYGFYFDNAEASTNTIIDCRIDETTHNGIYVASTGSLYGTQFYGINVDFAGEAAIRVDGLVSGCHFSGIVGRTGSYYRSKTVSQMNALGETEKRKACNVCIVGKSVCSKYDLLVSYNGYTETGNETNMLKFPSYIMYLGTNSDVLSSEFNFTGTFNADGTLTSSLNPAILKSVVYCDTAASIPLSGSKFSMNGIRFGSINNYAVYLYTNPWIESTFYPITADPTTTPPLRNVPFAIYNNEMYIGYVGGGGYKKVTVT